MSRVIDAIACERWAITEEGMRTVLAVATRSNDVEAIERELGRPLSNDSTVSVRDGVAIVPITGPLFRRANLFTRLSGATSYEILSREIGAALDSPEVRAIVLSIDSPGGAVSGVDELAELVYGARGSKPIIAHISGVGASAAYWIASAADFVIGTQTSIIGSIGAVIDVYVGSSEDDEDYLTFVSSVSPRKRLDPLEDDGQAEIQEIVDDTGRAFVETVARNRGISVDDVLSDYGQGGVFVGEKALNAGLIDRIATLEDVIARLNAAEGVSSAFTPAASGTHTSRPEEDPMADKNPAADGAEITREALERDHPEIVAAIQKDARESACAEERDRIERIHALNAPEDFTAELVSEGVSAGEAAERFVHYEREREKARAKAAHDARIEAEGALDAPAPGTDAATQSDEQQAIAATVALFNGITNGQPANA